jgi:hypothetical protein
MKISSGDVRGGSPPAGLSVGIIVGIVERNCGHPAAEFKPGDILAESRTENFARLDARDLPKLLVQMDDYNGDAITRFGLKLIADWERQAGVSRGE